MRIERIQVVAGLALLAIAFLLGSLFIGNGISDRGRNDTIDVTGSAKKRVRADQATWSASLSVQNADPATAARQLARWTAEVRQFLREEGIREEELEVAPISTSLVGDDEYSESVSKVKAYQLTRYFEVDTKRVDAMADFAEAASQLIARGIPLSPNAVEYTFTKLPSLRPQLLAEAVKDAKRRSGVLVEGTGAKIGKIRGIHVGVFQITAPNSTDVSDYGEYDTSTIQKDVTAVVNLTFALE
jgi:hypothetical protein